jgi:hypothetical protein
MSSVARRAFRGANMAQRGQEKRPVAIDRWREGELPPETGLGIACIFANLRRLRRLTGIPDGVVSLGDCHDRARAVGADGRCVASRRGGMHPSARPRHRSNLSMRRSRWFLLARTVRPRRRQPIGRQPLLREGGGIIVRRAKFGFVIAGLDPAIHPFEKSFYKDRWMRGSGPRMMSSVELTSPAA